MEYLAEESTEAVALYGTGVLVSVPPPIKYAIHKLLIAHERRSGSPKRAKDLRQARDLLDIFSETDQASFEDALEEARDRGPKWKRNIDASLREIRRDVRQARLSLLPRRATIKPRQRRDA
jgi:hypothetical protein